MAKRYVLVRVDNKCPRSTEGFNAFTCEDLFRCGYLWQLGQDTDCKDFCRYGDTKEQLVRKVETAIRRLQADKNRIIVGYDMWAKFIVEFLGVEE